MAYVPKRPWWKFWPVICWKHWKRVKKNSICEVCSAQTKRFGSSYFCCYKIGDTEIAVGAKSKNELLELMRITNVIRRTC